MLNDDVNCDKAGTNGSKSRIDCVSIKVYDEVDCGRQGKMSVLDGETLVGIDAPFNGENATGNERTGDDGGGSDDRSCGGDDDNHDGSDDGRKFDSKESDDGDDDIDNGKSKEYALEHHINMDCIENNFGCESEKKLQREDTEKRPLLVSSYLWSAFIQTCNFCRVLHYCARY